jgi:catechol 2,3-dioxygenase-like lactoylglutathione lyase family enzyme
LSITRVSSVILVVKDLQRSISFYRDVLGMKLKYTIPGEFAFLDGGGIDLALRMTSEPVNPGLTEVVFDVLDIHGTYETLKSKGVVFPYPPRVVTGNEKSELFATDFRDPDGHVLSITSWVTK